MQFLSKNFFAFVFAKRGAKVMLFLIPSKFSWKFFFDFLALFRISLGFSNLTFPPTKDRFTMSAPHLS